MSIAEVMAKLKCEADRADAEIAAAPMQYQPSQTYDYDMAPPVLRVG